VIVAIGGDGTCSRVADEILRNEAECQLAVIPLGTGNDFAKTLGVAKMTFTEIAALVSTRNSSRVDVGRVDAEHFLNSCGFGFDASVLEASRHVRFLRGNAVYIYSALAKLFTYKGTYVSTEPSVDRAIRKMLMLTVSNGRYLGGAFCIAPSASPVDGKLDFGLFAATTFTG